MNKKIKIIIISFVIFSVLGVSTVIGYNKLCIDPEAEMLRELQQKGNLSEGDKERLKGLSVLEAEEAKRCAFLDISSERKQYIIEEKQRRNEEYLKELDRKRQQGLLEPQKLLSLELGIREIDQVLPSSIFRQINAWQGYLDNNFILVAAGGSYSEPLKGMVVVLEGGFSGSREIYYTPTLKGPIKIIAEKNGVLTLESTTGEYEVYYEDVDKREKMKTPGGTTYYFNIQTKTFQ